MGFDERHPILQWFPNVIVFLFLGVTGAALAINFVNPVAGLTGYLLALVTVDFGMAAVAVLSWIIGRRLWREDHDPRYLAAAIAFAGLPVWGVLQTFCVTWLIPQLSSSQVCGYSENLSYVAVLWLVLVILVAVLRDFRAFLRGRNLPQGRAGPPTPR